MRAAKAYGDPNWDNGVTLKFAEKIKGDRAGTVSRNGTELEQDPHNPGGIRATVTVTINSNLGGSELEETVAHEGSHVGDYQAFANALGDPKLNITLRESEIRAYHISIDYALRGNISRNLGYCGMKPCEFRPGMMPALLDATINQLLDDPRNHYAGLDRKIYPELP